MKDKMQIQFELLMEVDQICRENHLYYILCDNTAFYAYEQKSIQKIVGTPRIAMTMQDAERFGEIVGKKMPDRYFESRKNSPDYVGFTASYGNKNTTKYDMFTGKNRINHGIEIEILYIVDSVNNPLQRKLNRILEICWTAVVIQGVTKKEFAFWLCQSLANLFRSIIGKQRFGRLYYNYILNAKGKIDLLAMKKDQNVLIQKSKIPAELLQDRESYMVDGYPFMVPKDLETFMVSYFGKMWKDQRFKDGLPKYDSQVVLVDIPFQKIVPEIEKTYDIDKIREEYIYVLYKQTPVYKEKKKIDNNWKHLLKTVDAWYAQKRKE